MRTRVQTSPSPLLDRLLLRTSRTFALSIPELPQPTRAEVTTAYLLFRIADTLEDATDWTPGRKVSELGRLDSLLAERSLVRPREVAEHWSASPPLGNPDYLELLRATPEVLQAFEELGRPARDCIRTHIRRTIERMTAFVELGARVRTLASVEQLQAYCYAVAGIVGEMLTELFLLGRPGLDGAAPELRRNAAVFGEALQLVNILKDSTFDAREGRRYLPDDTAPAQIFALARRDLQAAREYVLCLQRHEAPRGLVAFTALPVLLAWTTLQRVERAGPGAKLTREEVAGIVERLGRALLLQQPAVPEFLDS